jgi:adenosylcobinamide-GDP ribazoletransferase
LAQLRYAISLLTVFPVGRRPIQLRSGEVGPAIGYAPFVGVLIWLPAAGIMFGARVLLDGTASFVVPTIGLGVAAALTGGLHLDGLADVGDAIGSRKPAAQALAIMKDPHIGALGAVTVLFVVLAQAGSLSLAIQRHHGTVTLLTALMAGRLAVVLACRPGIPAASSEGLGAGVIGTVSRLRAAAVTVATLPLPGERPRGSGRAGSSRRRRGGAAPARTPIRRPQRRHVRRACRGDGAGGPTAHGGPRPDVAALTA